MWPRRACRKQRVEVEVESPIQFEAVLVHPDDMHLMIALEVNLPEIIFVEEIVDKHQSLVVISESNRVRTGILAQADDSRLPRMLGIADVQHADLPA